MGKDKAPILLFVRPALINIFTKDSRPQAPPEISPIPSAIVTPFGMYPYPGIHRLLFVPIPYVDENGLIGHIQMRSLYLDIIVDSMATNLQLTSLDLIKCLADYSRIAIVGGLVGDKPMLLYSQPYWEQAVKPYPLPEIADEYYPCYYGISKDPDQIENIRRLEATTEYCLNNRLNALPPSVLDGWQVGFLQPLLAQIKSKLESAPIKD